MRRLGKRVYQTWEGWGKGNRRKKVGEKCLPDVGVLGKGCTRRGSAGERQHWAWGYWERIYRTWKCGERVVWTWGCCRKDMLGVGKPGLSSLAYADHVCQIVS